MKAKDSGLDERQLNRVLHGFDLYDKNTRNAARIAQQRISEGLLSESKKIVPVATSNLQKSAYKKEFREGGMWWSEVGYSAEYALPVHEIPAPPAVSEGGRSAMHNPPRRWKYLEEPYLELLPTYNEKIAREIKKALRRMKKK